MSRARTRHHRPDLRDGDPQGAPRRLPRRHRAGDPAHHRRDQALHRRGAPTAPTSRLVEIGGTVGDIESLPFLEAIRQIAHRARPANALFMHLTLVPYIAAAGELKTKPTQHSVKELRAIGIQPDMLLCRSEQPLPDSERRKIALFTNVAGARGDLGARRRQHLQDPAAGCTQQGLDEIVVERLGTWTPRAAPTCPNGRHGRRRASIRSTRSRSAIVGKYVDHQDAYKSLTEALNHGGIANARAVNLKWLDSEDVEKRGRRRRSHGVDGILVPGGFGDRGIEGKIAAAQLRARARHAVFRHLLRHAGRGDRVRAQRLPASTAPTAPRTTPHSPHPVIGLITEWRTQTGDVERRSEEQRPRRHHAPGPAGRSASSRARSRTRCTATTSSASATATATSSTTATARSSRTRAW